MPSYLVTGANGQLGQCLRAVAQEFIEINLYFSSKNEVDITQLDSIKSFYKKSPFDGIINCAAYTSVDQAERDQKNASKINVEGVQYLIAFAEDKNLSIIHFSTDYVFDGNSTEPYHEESALNPISIYGISKQKGERLLSKSICKNVSIRTSWLFSPFENNFVKTIVNLSQEKSILKIVDDQWGRPTYGIDLARTILTLISNDTIYKLPILHYANQGVCSWKAFAEAIVNEVERSATIKGIPSSDYPTLAKRPKYSVLDTGCIEKELGIVIPTWEESLKKCIQILKNDEGF
jgi:dTDP-4-dehydrorhamnose reductase